MAAPPLEANIVKAIVRRLKREPRCWYMKVHGSSYGRAGVPDIIGCLHGRMFALEVKRPGRLHSVSKLQEYELRTLADAGAKAAVVESLEDACEVLGLDVR